MATRTASTNPAHEVTEGVLTLRIVTPERQLLKAEKVEEVFVPAFRGELNILPGHVPLMTVLDTGLIRYRRVGSSSIEGIVVSWGYCEVSPVAVTILAETAEAGSDVDIDRAKASLKLAESASHDDSLEEEAYGKVARKLRRAELRLEVASAAQGTRQN